MVALDGAIISRGMALRNKGKLFSILSLVACLLSGGCSQVVKHGMPLPEVQALAVSDQKLGTIIAPLDSIDIKFLFNPEMNETLTVPLNGSISLALFDNPIPAAGLTPHQLAEKIRQAYSKVMRDAVVTVQVRSFANLHTFVAGEVGMPGAQVMTSPLTVFQAISAAGGFKPTARTDEVVVVRQTATNGQRMVFSVDLDKVISGEDPSQDVALQPLDVVFVPRSDAARVANAIDQYFRQLLPVPTSGSLGAAYDVTTSGTKIP